jgi:hypothetical protein
MAVLHSPSVNWDNVQIMEKPLFYIEAFGFDIKIGSEVGFEPAALGSEFNCQPV